MEALAGMEVGAEARAVSETIGIEMADLSANAMADTASADAARMGAEAETAASEAATAKCREAAVKALEHADGAGGGEAAADAEQAVKELDDMAEDPSLEREANGEISADGEADLFNEQGSAWNRLTERSKGMLRKTQAQYSKVANKVDALFRKAGKSNPQVKEAHDAMEACDRVGTELNELRAQKGKARTPAQKAKWEADMKDARERHAKARKQVDEKLGQIEDFYDRIEAKGGRYSKELAGTLIKYRRLLATFGGFLLFLQLTADALSGCYKYTGVYSVKLHPPGSQSAGTPCKYTDGRWGRENCSCVDGMDQSENPNQPNE